MFTTSITSGAAALTPTPVPTPALLHERQLWGLPSVSSSTTDTATICGSFDLPSGGTLVLNPTSTIVFAADAVYQPVCTNKPAAILNGSLPVVDDRDVFYASIIPLIYVIAGCTFVAWFLLIILLLLPGSYVGLIKRRPSRAWRPTARNFLSYITDRPTAGSSRPWLQKAAAFLVVLAMTTVTADTFRYSKEQYEQGFLDADDLRLRLTSYEIRIIRVISDLFLWLAQIQALIRLFPRHKEKLIIKWIGFLLILLDIIFSCLNSFYIDARPDQPLQYSDAISALSYLFQLSMNLLYAAWVLYYSLTKRKYAYFHSLMPSISLVAFFSVVSVLIPVVFFLVDLVELPVSIWGEYFRWLGSAASSIVVWEWVERIEALERDEKKDGILGREIFEEDETDNRTSPDASARSSLDGGYSSDTLVGSRPLQAPTAKWRAFAPGIAHLRSRKRKRAGDGVALDEKHGEDERSSAVRDPQQRHRSLDGRSDLAYPARAASPVDRKQTGSTGSTVYAVHYHPVADTPPSRPDDPQQQAGAHDDSPAMGEAPPTQSGGQTGAAAGSVRGPGAPHGGPGRRGRAQWSFAANAFRRSRKSPPIEIKNALSSAADSTGDDSNARRRPALVIGRIASLAGLREEESPSQGSPQEPTVIPAPPRGQLWSPDTQTHSPIQHQDTPDSGASFAGQRRSATPAARNTPAVSSSSGSHSAAQATRTPTPAKLAGGHSAAYDFGNTPRSAANGGNARGASGQGPTPPGAGPSEGGHGRMTPDEHSSSGGHGDTDGDTTGEAKQGD